MPWIAEETGLFRAYDLEFPWSTSIRPEAFQAILDDVAQTDPRAKKVMPEDFIDRRFLDEMTKSSFFDKLGAEKS